MPKHRFDNCKWSMYDEDSGVLRDKQGREVALLRMFVDTTPAAPVRIPKVDRREENEHGTRFARTV